METNSRHTVLSNLAVVVADVLDTYGVDGRALLSDIGIDYAFACDPDTRIPYEQNHLMWEMAAEQSGDPCFGIEVAERFNPGLLHGLGFSWMASGSLKEAFARVLRFQKLINTGGNFHAETSDNRIRIIAELGIPGYRHPPAYVMSMLAAVVRMSRLTAGRDVNPVLVTFTQHAPLDTTRINNFFLCPVQFGGPQNTLVFSRAVIEEELPTANPRLARINDQIVIDYLARYDQQSLVARAQARIVELLPSGRPNQIEVAQSLNMSLRNFQRRLKQDGTSFRELIDTIRKELAIEFIRDSQRPIGAISYNLGYTEPANFTRSFRAWTGMSPRQYRESLDKAELNQGSQ